MIIGKQESSRHRVMGRVGKSLNPGNRTSTLILGRAKTLALIVLGLDQTSADRVPYKTRSFVDIQFLHES